MTTSRRAWPRKPPKGTRRDGSVGTTFDTVGSPVVMRCPNEATETCIEERLNHEAWLCGECAESMAERGIVVRRKAS